MTTTETKFSAFQMASEYGQTTFDVYSNVMGFVGHFKADDKEGAIDKARRAR